LHRVVMPTSGNVTAPNSPFWPAIKSKTIAELRRLVSVRLSKAYFRARAFEATLEGNGG
jgi:hypothetical protein